MAVFIGSVFSVLYLLFNASPRSVSQYLTLYNLLGTTMSSLCCKKNYICTNKVKMALKHTSYLLPR